MYFYCYVHSVYSVSLCCSVCCLCVNVYWAAATGCQPICIFNKIRVQYINVNVYELKCTTNYILLSIVNPNFMYYELLCYNL
jgi:hypothetical protein